MLALATANADFQPVMQRDDCVFSMSQREADGVTPVRVECRWSDRDAPELDTLLSQVGSYHEIVWAIEDSRVVDTRGDRSLVWQRHVVKGTAPREVMVWMEAKPTIAGGTRYSWTTADVDFDLSRGAVEAPRNDGYWEVTPTVDGVEVVLQGSYDPGGWVPDWLVRWCQTFGADRLMKDVRALTVPAAGAVVDAL